MDARPAIVLIVERRELPQDIFGKGMRVVCERVVRAHREGRAVGPMMVCWIVREGSKP